MERTEELPNSRPANLLPGLANSTLSNQPDEPPEASALHSSYSGITVRLTEISRLAEPFRGRIEEVMGRTVISSSERLVLPLPITTGIPGLDRWLDSRRPMQWMPAVITLVALVASMHA